MTDQVGKIEQLTTNAENLSASELSHITEQFMRDQSMQIESLTAQLSETSKKLRVLAGAESIGQFRRLKVQLGIEDVISEM